MIPSMKMRTVLLKHLRPKLHISGHLHWQQYDLFGDNGAIDTHVVTLGRIKYGDYGILNNDQFILYRNNIKYCDIYYNNRDLFRGT